MIWYFAISFTNYKQSLNEIFFTGWGNERLRDWDVLHEAVASNWISPDRGRVGLEDRLDAITDTLRHSLQNKVRWKIVKVDLTYFHK